MRIRSGLALVAAALLVAFTAPAGALADPPPNDNRGSAQVVDELPATLDGTTVEATQEDNEQSASCAGSINGSVWYRVRPGRDGRIIAGLAANGDLDAVVDVFRVRRSQLDFVTCDTTDDNGRTSLSFSVTADQTYLIRVAPLANSVQDSFRLTLQLGQPEAEPPGVPLPRSGATGRLDRVLNPSDAYSVDLRQGVTYRFNLASDACTPLRLYPPGTKSFNAGPAVAGASCGGYFSFTPGRNEGGRYSLLAVGPRGRRPVSYRLTADRAGADDTAPGRFIRNYARVKGALDAGHIDVIDLYRFDVTRRSDLDLVLRTDKEFSVTLLSAHGRRIARGQSIRRKVKRGRYFAVVRAARGASGSYRLRRISRTITRTRATVDGKDGATVPPGTSVLLGASLTPGVSGPVRLELQRYDPVAGWQFVRTFRVRASNGVASVSYRPPSVGRWRVRAEFLGTRASSPSASDFTTFQVQGPLEE